MSHNLTSTNQIIAQLFDALKLLVYLCLLQQYLQRIPEGRALPATVAV
jgi:hypothetical protein